MLFVTAMLFGSGIWAQSDSLEYYLGLGAQSNPGLQAAFAEAQAALQRTLQAGALEDPKLEMGFFLPNMMLVEGRQAAEFKLMQMFPWFGLRGAARTEAQHSARMSYELFRAACDDLRLAISTGWFGLCRLKANLRYNTEQRDLLLRLEALALRRMEAPAGGSGGGSAMAPRAMEGASTAGAMGAASASGAMGGMNGMGGSSVATPPQKMQTTSAMPSMNEPAGAGMSNVLNIRMELAETNFAIESIESEIAAEMAAFNALLNRPPNSEIALPDSISPNLFLWNEAEMPAIIQRQNPMLAMLNEEAEMYRAKERMDKLMGMPMLGVGLQYMLINRLPAANNMDMEGSATDNSMNGKDMLMPMISVSIPIYRGKYKAKTLEDRYMRQAAIARLEETANLLSAELSRLKHKLADASRRINLYQQQSSLAATACKLAEQNFASGNGSLAETIQAQRRLLDYKLKAVEAIADHNIIVANINKLLSSDETE